MKARARRWYCRACAWPAPFGDYVWAVSRAAARDVFFHLHHVRPYSVEVD